MYYYYCSANILLTEDLVPKIGDFGIIREGPSNPNKDHTGKMKSLFEIVFLV